MATKIAYANGLTVDGLPMPLLVTDNGDGTYSPNIAAELTLDPTNLATSAKQDTQITAEQAILAAVAKTATFVPIAAVASSMTTIPVGAFDIGILILTGTGTVGGVDWPANIPLNIKGRLAVAVDVVLANPGTARITYST